MNQPVFYQRLEAAFLFALSVLLYFWLHFQLVWFVIFLFSIDVFMLGYLFNKTIGAHIYNIGHSLVIPIVLVAASIATSNNFFLAAGIIWTAHIGWDRALGYGLKFSSGFKDTHLGHIGKK